MNVNSSFTILTRIGQHYSNTKHTAGQNRVPPLSFISLP